MRERESAINETCSQTALESRFKRERVADQSGHHESVIIEAILSAELTCILEFIVPWRMRDGNESTVRVDEWLRHRHLR